MKTCVLLETFLEVMSLSKMIVFLAGVINLETSLLSSPVISIFLSVNISNLLTYSGNFLGFPQPYSISIEGAKGADENIMLTWSSLSDGKSAKDISRGAYIEAAGIRSTCIKDTCTSRYISVGNTTFAEGADAVEDSKIHS